MSAALRMTDYRRLDLEGQPIGHPEKGYWESFGEYGGELSATLVRE